MTHRDPARPVTGAPPAELDRRFYALAIDRLVAWGLIGAGSYLSYELLLDRDRVGAGIAAISAPS